MNVHGSYHVSVITTLKGRSSVCLNEGLHKNWSMNTAPQRVMREKEVLLSMPSEKQKKMLVCKVLASKWGEDCQHRSCIYGLDAKIVSSKHLSIFLKYGSN